MFVLENFVHPMFVRPGTKLWGEDIPQVFFEGKIFPKFKLFSTVGRNFFLVNDRLDKADIGESSSMKPMQILVYQTWVFCELVCFLTDKKKFLTDNTNKSNTHNTISHWGAGGESGR